METQRQSKFKTKRPKMLEKEDTIENTYDSSNDNISPKNPPTHPLPGSKRRFSQVQSKSAYLKTCKKLEFCEEFKPKRMSDVLVAKDRVRTFTEFMENPNSKIMFLLGPSGCGK